MSPVSSFILPSRTQTNVCCIPLARASSSRIEALRSRSKAAAKPRPACRPKPATAYDSLRRHPRLIALHQPLQRPLEPTKADQGSGHIVVMGVRDLLQSHGRQSNHVLGVDTVIPILRTVDK